MARDYLNNPLYKGLIDQVEDRLRQVIREELERVCGQREGDGE